MGNLIELLVCAQRQELGKCVAEHHLLEQSGRQRKVAALEPSLNGTSPSRGEIELPFLRA